MSSRANSWVDSGARSWARHPILMPSLTLVASYQVLRLAFLICNQDALPEFSATSALHSLWNGLRFDLCAITLVNAPLFLLWASPIKLGPRTLLTAKSFFVVVNTLFLGLNIVDIEYFQFVGRRLDLGSFAIAHDIQEQLISLVSYYWVMALLTLLCGFVLWRSCDALHHHQPTPARSWGRLLPLLAAMIVMGRGGVQAKPLDVTHAFQNRSEAWAVATLNSTFTIIKSYKAETLSRKDWFTDWESTLAALSPPPAGGAHSLLPNDTNIVIIILESFNREYMGFGHDYSGYTPFLDELAQRGTFFPNMFANGRRSIDALPSIMAGIPTLMKTPLIRSPYQAAKLIGLPEILSQRGWHSAFFHGGHDGTMFFDIIASRLGFQEYFGADAFPDQSQDDGNWGIFDEPYLQFAAKTMTRFQQPFLSVLFTLSSHHPYTVPKSLEAELAEGTLPIHKSIRYTDLALRRFFATAEVAPWYRNTLFVITADHTSKSEREEYSQRIGRFRVPLILFHPQVRFSDIDPGPIAQHTDILPTILAMLGIDARYARFGRSLIEPDRSDAAAMFFGFGKYWLVSNELAFISDGDQDHVLLRWRSGEEITEPTEGEQNRAIALEHRLRSHVQYFNNGLIEDRLNW